MNWTNLVAKVAQIFIGGVLFVGLSTPLYAQENPFEELKERFESGEVFSADFRHQSIDSYTRDTVASNGWIWVGETQYKVRTDQQSVVVNGKTSMVYDNNRNRVIISKYEPSEDDFAPSRILNGIDSTYTVTTEEWRDDQYYIRLASEDPFAIYKEVEIYLSKQLTPQKIRAVDPVDNVITTRFSDGEFMATEAKTFLLDYPDGAKVVDMRN
ncbi:LolA family protein [Fodinibius salsisoli]|uniref:Outer membrane lipoprotein carrier protein LolA n=1 Tax=Fodinibius salsisoli TaxID=2820877 RepID=A0ABT3PRE9_9BACT|nr:outer membrane lipoprotein carrier protein LolA [Fodinibius salsisoli]MCW9708442.1 outer membrane lipoprotein carrier protein LolA [Fodinibius salsisoli]